MGKCNSQEQTEQLQAEAERKRKQAEEADRGVCGETEEGGSPEEGGRKDSLGGGDDRKDDFAACADLDPAKTLKTAARDMMEKLDDHTAAAFQKMADDMDSVGDEESKGLKKSLLEFADYRKKKEEYDAGQAEKAASAEAASQAERDRIAKEEADELAAEQAEQARKQYQIDHANAQQRHRRKTIPAPLYGVSNAESVKASDPEGLCAHIVTVTCEWIEKHNYDADGVLIEEGIFRTAASKAWVNAKIKEFNTNPFCELTDADSIPNIASLLIRYFLDMEAKGYYLWGPTDAEARAWEDKYMELFKATRKDEDALIVGIKQLVSELGVQERAAWKKICHMLRGIIHAPNCKMDAKKMSLCVRAPIQGQLVHMIMEWDLMFGDMKDI